MNGLRAVVRLGVALLGAAVMTPTLGGTASAAAAGSTSTQALAAAVTVGREAATLVQLGVFTPQNSQGLPPTVQALALPGASHAQLVARLKSVEADGQRWLAVLEGGGRQLFPAVEQALTPLSPTDLARASAGKSISVPADTFMGALDALLFTDGAPLAGPPADPPTLQAALSRAIRKTAGVRPPRSVPPASSGPAFPAAPPTGQTAPVNATKSHSSLLALIVGAVLVCVVGAGAYFWLRARRRVRRTAAWGPGGNPAQPTPPQAVAAPGAQMSDLLDVSRRLASITAVDEIHRVIVREAMGLVHSSSAALIVRDGDQLVIAHEGPPGLLVSEQLADGALGRVAETGQPTRQVSATEAAIRQLPAALLAVPLVAGGSVAAVLVLVREAMMPFSAEESELLMALTPVAAAAMSGAAQSTEAMRRSLQDGLTGVGNRSRFDRDLAAVIADTATRPLTLMMIDLDRFKAVNDTHGHPAGDALLAGLGDVLRRTIRPGDGVYRYGGEEFALLMPNTASADAADLAERVRLAVGTNSFDVAAGVRLMATVSIGVATVNSGDGQTLVGLADAALYEAKRGGRNRVCIAANALSSG